MSKRSHLGLALCIAAGLAAHALILASDQATIQAVGALILTVALPGYLLGELLWGRDLGLDGLERAVLAAGIGFAVLTAASMFLSYLPGPLTRMQLLLGFDGLALILLGLNAWGRVRSTWTLVDRSALLGLAVVLVIAAALRFPSLGYAEFQGDEGRAMLRAAEVLQGNDQVLFLHKKGPVEILFPAAIYGLAGRINEAAARLPFACANLVALAALYILGRRFFGAKAGLAAAALLALDGFCLGFAGIVQYQSVVLLMTILGVFCAERVRQRAPAEQGYLLGAALLVSTGMLAHYEGFFALPPMVYLIWSRYRREPEGLWRACRRLVLPAALGGALLAAFYLPFVANPEFANTSVYLSEKRVGGGLLYNNIADYFHRSSFYSSAYYPAVLGALLAAAAAGLLARGVVSARARLGLAVLAAVWLAMLFTPSLLMVAGASLAAAVFLLTVGLALRRELPAPQRAVVWWFGATALFYFFLMLKVHTHYYVVLPAWILLVAPVVVRADDWLSQRRRVWAWVARGLAGLWAVACLGYLAVAFVRQTPEYRVAYPQSTPSIYLMPYGGVAPRGGYFGFPYRTAWKAVGALYAQGVLQGAYDSNQEDLVTNWYTRGALRLPGADTYIVARDLENPHSIIPGVIDGTYRPYIEIQRDGVGQIWVFRRGYEGEMQCYDGEALAADFDRDLSAPVFRVGAPLDELFAPPHAVGAVLGDTFELAGWDLDRTLVAPGEDALLTLYWRGLQTTATAYHVYAHLGEEPAVAQADSEPKAGELPTYRWLAGQEVVDRYLLHVDEAAEPAVYTLWLGMYEAGTQKRLEIVDPSGTSLGKSLQLARVRVGAPLTAAPAVANPSATALGGRARLVGYEFAADDLRPGDTLRVRLLWQCLAPFEASYTVFAHLEGPDGVIYGQGDSLPLGGRLPTDFWQVGEYIDDAYVISVGADAPEGEYRLAVGMYDVQTGARLEAVQDTGGRWTDDRVLLSGIHVVSDDGAASEVAP